MTQFIRPILYPKQDVPHAPLGAAHRTQAEIAAMNDPHHVEPPEVRRADAAYIEDES